MRKNLSIIGLSAITALLTAFAARADYSNTVMSLGPVAYWPLNETAQPPAPYYASNSGTLGALANGYRELMYTPAEGTGFVIMSQWNGSSVAGATADGDMATFFTGNPNCYIQVPHTFSSTVPKVPLTVECWIKPLNVGDVENIVGAGGMYNRSFNGNGDWAGFNLYLTNSQWAFSVYNTNGANASVQAVAPISGSGTWDYVVATFDGINAKLYVNGNLMDTEVASNNAAGLAYVPDNINPIVIGKLNPANGGSIDEVGSINAFVGTIDEVAIYTNALSSSSITSHFNAAAGSSYASTVASDHPPIYLRLDDPDYTVPDATAFTSFPVTSTFPRATNYGSSGSGANGYYQPGTLPGVAGPTGTGFGSANYSVAINGMYGAVDVGGGFLPQAAPALSTTDSTPVSVVAWYKGNPADSYNRFQNILGQGDSGWRIGLAGVGPQFNPGGGGELGSSDAYNDGFWHMVVGVYDGNTNYIYMDGQLVFSVPNSNTQSGSQDDVFLGGAPDYTFLSGRYLNGSIAQVTFYTNVVSSANIKQLYNDAGMIPHITRQPLAAVLNAGVNYINASRAIIAGSSLTFQWYQNGSPVSGQTNQNLAFTPMQTTNAGNYFVIATNSSGSVTSSIVALSINTNLLITTQSSTNLVLFKGVNPTLSVTGSGSLPIYYYWNSNNVVVAASTNSNYFVTNDIGSVNYFCLVSNAYASVTSSIISVSTIPVPTNSYPLTVLSDSPVAYWRLGETDQGYPNNGVAAFDNVGGHNGIYANSVLGVSGYPSAVIDPNTAAYFGDPSALDSDMQVAAGINFGTGGNAKFTLEAWVFVPAGDVQYLQGDGSGIITLGQGAGGEQFDLDTGSSDNNSQPAFRFLVRDANGDTSIAGSSVTVGDGNWHHVVCVCDEANGHIFLYVDGNLSGSDSINPGSGLQNSSNPLSIGARQSGTDHYDDQFPGMIDEVAIYNYPLSSSQVKAHYDSASAVPAAPSITQQPPSGTAIQGTSIPLSVVVSGTPPFQYQWYQDGMPVGTDSSIYDANIFAGSHSYYCAVSSGLGTITSATNIIKSVVLTDSGTNSSTSITTFAVNFTDAAGAAYTPDNGNTWFNTIYQGLGAYADNSANTNWNGFGLDDGFSPTFNSAVAPQVASDGSLLTPITLSLVYNRDYESSTGLEYGPGMNGNTSQTDPSLVLAVAAAVDSAHTGAGTADQPLGGITLSNVPAGTYVMYLYGTAPDNNFGAVFNFTSGAPLGGTNMTINANDGIPASNFVYGVTYIIYTNVVPDASGVITGTWGVVNNPISGNSGEGDFNGLQLVRISGAPATTLPIVSIQLVGTSSVISWTPTNGILQSASTVTGPYSDIGGSVSPYTNVISGAQQFFRVKVSQP